MALPVGVGGTTPNRPTAPAPKGGGFLSNVAQLAATVARGAATTVSRSAARPLPPAPVRSAVARPARPSHPASAPGMGPPTPAERVMNDALDRMYQGPAQPFLLPLDPVARQTSPIPRQLEVRGQFNQDFSALQKAGMLPPGAKQPQLVFPARGAGPNGDLPYEKNGTVFLSPTQVASATYPGSPQRWWGLATPIHEIAHTLQSADVLGNVPLREGGAQAFADSAVPRVLGPIPTHDTNYTRYVQQVEALGAPWYMRGQFGAGSGAVIASQRRKR